MCDKVLRALGLEGRDVFRLMLGWDACYLYVKETRMVYIAAVGDTLDDALDKLMNALHARSWMIEEMYTRGDGVVCLSVLTEPPARFRVRAIGGTEDFLTDVVVYIGMHDYDIGVAAGCSGR